MPAYKKHDNPEEQQRIKDAIQMYLTQSIKQDLCAQKFGLTKQVFNYYYQKYKLSSNKRIIFSETEPVVEQSPARAKKVIKISEPKQARTKQQQLQKEWLDEQNRINPELNNQSKVQKRKAYNLKTKIGKNNKEYLDIEPFMTKEDNI